MDIHINIVRISVEIYKICLILSENLKMASIGWKFINFLLHRRIRFDEAIDVFALWFERVASDLVKWAGIQVWVRGVSLLFFIEFTQPFPLVLFRIILKILMSSILKSGHFKFVIWNFMNLIWINFRVSKLHFIKAKWLFLEQTCSYIVLQIAKVLPSLILLFDLAHFCIFVLN